jgi:hypothetical protein
LGLDFWGAAVASGVNSIIIISLVTWSKPPRGLMWLTLARDSAKDDDKWINEFYQNAFKQTNNDERARALMYLEHWLKSRAIDQLTDGPVG